MEKEKNINYELHNIKNQNNYNSYYNKNSINRMLKTAQKYMSFSKWKEMYKLIFEEEGKKI